MFRRRRVPTLGGALVSAALLVSHALLVVPSVGATAPPAQEAPSLPRDLPAGDEARVLSPDVPNLRGRLHVVYWPGDEGLARTTVAAIEGRAALPGLPATVPSEVMLYLAPDVPTWDYLTGGGVPEWGAGVAIPDRATAVIPLFLPSEGGPSGRGRTAVHEWAHLGLHEYLEGLQIPRWFDEGYAQRAAGGWNLERAWRLRLALTAGTAPPFDSLTLAWPRSATESELAYLLAGSAVEYLTAESGDRGLEVLLTRWRDVNDFETAFRRTYGLTTGTFESRWTDHVERSYGWILILYEAAAFWLVASLLLLAAWRWRARRIRVKLAALRASEPPRSPAYWEGPPTPPIGGFR